MDSRRAHHAACWARGLVSGATALGGPGRQRAPFLNRNRPSQLRRACERVPSSRGPEPCDRCPCPVLPSPAATSGLPCVSPQGSSRLLLPPLCPGHTCAWAHLYPTPIAHHGGPGPSSARPHSGAPGAGLPVSGGAIDGLAWGTPAKPEGRGPPQAARPDAEPVALESLPAKASSES